MYIYCSIFDIFVFQVCIRNISRIFIYIFFFKYNIYIYEFTFIEERLKDFYPMFRCLYQPESMLSVFALLCRSLEVPRKAKPVNALRGLAGV